MKVVYIAGPFRGKTAWDIEQNIRRAESVAYEVALAGAAPLCPHANTRYFHGTLTDAFWIDATVELLRRCDAVMLVKGWENSSGTRGEIVVAESIGIPIWRQIEDLKEWIKS